MSNFHVVEIPKSVCRTAHDEVTIQGSPQLPITYQIGGPQTQRPAIALPLVGPEGGWPIKGEGGLWGRKLLRAKRKCLRQRLI